MTAGIVCPSQDHCCSVETSSPKEVRAGAQTGQEPEAGADAEAMERCLLTGLLSLSYSTQDH